MLAMTAIGLGSFLAVINVRYRDVPYAVPFLVQLWLFASGVIYAADAIPEKYLEHRVAQPCRRRDHRLPLGRRRHPALRRRRCSVLGVTTAVVFFVGGLWFYRRAEPRFADTL